MHSHSVNNEKTIYISLTAVIIFVALSDFLSKNIIRLLPSTRTIPGQIIPDEIIQYWSLTINQNLITGVIILVSILFVFSMTSKTTNISIINYRFEILIPVLAFFIGIYLWRLPEGNVDYYRYYSSAKIVHELGLIEYFEKWKPSGTDLPIIPVIYGLLFNIFGVSRIVIQIFKTICFAFTSYLLFRLGLMIWNRTVGIYASIIPLVTVPFILQVPNTLVDIPYVFLIVLFTYLLLTTYRSRFWLISAFLTILLITLIVLSKGTSSIYVPVIFSSLTLMEIYRTKELRPVFLKAVFILIGAFTILSFLLVLYHDKLLLFYAGQSSLREADTGIVFPVLQVISNFIFETWTLRDPHYWIRNMFYLLGSIVTVLSFCSIVYLIKKRDVRFVLLFGWIVIPIFFLPGGQRFDLIRYFFPSIPAFAIGSAFIISKFKPKIRHLLLISIVLSSLLTVSLIELPIKNATGMAAIQSSCNLANSLDVDSVGIVHVSETPWGKVLQARKGQVIIHFEYNLIHEVKYYHTEDLIQDSGNSPILLILVSDTYNIPNHLQDFLLRYNHISTSEGYLGGSWSPIICRVYTLKA